MGPKTEKSVAALGVRNGDEGGVPFGAGSTSEISVVVDTGLGDDLSVSALVYEFVAIGAGTLRLRLRLETLRSETSAMGKSDGRRPAMFVRC